MTGRWRFAARRLLQAAALGLPALCIAGVPMRAAAQTSYQNFSSFVLGAPTPNSPVTGTLPLVQSDRRTHGLSATIPWPVASGGTGATTTTGALTALGAANNTLSNVPEPAGRQSIVPGGVTTLYYATDYGSPLCTWDGATGHDVGPCINAAIAAAAAGGGGYVVVPAGAYYFKTEIVNNTSGVNIIGAGVGYPLTPVFAATTRLVWNGSAGQSPAVFVGNSGAGAVIANAGIQGIAVDANNTANVGVEMAVQHSTIQVGCANAVLTCFWGTTLSGGISPGFAFNDVWIVAQETQSSSATGTPILFDGQGGWAGSDGNVNGNRMHFLEAFYSAGDGIVFGFSDTNKIEEIYSYHSGTATSGSPIVFANNNYVPPSGVAVSGYASANKVEFTRSAIREVGYTTGSTFTMGGGNTGTAAFSTVTLATNATSAAGSNVLNFASTTGVVAGMSASCGGSASGIAPTYVTAVTSTTVTVANGAVISGGVSGVASGQTCTFASEVSDAAVPGTYTLTAVDGTHWSLTAPSGGHSQSNVAITSGVVKFQDMAVAISGTPNANDTATVVVPKASTLNFVGWVDKTNSITDPNVEPGATGVVYTPANPYPNVAGSPGITCNTYFNGGSAITLAAANKATGYGAIACGGNGNTASGSISSVVGSVNSTASAFGSSVFGCDGCTSSGVFGSAIGGASITDRGRYGTTVFGAGDFSTPGDAQGSQVLLRGLTSNTSAARLTADGATAGSANCVNIPANTAYLLQLSIVAIDHTTPTNNEEWSNWTGLLTRASGNAALTMETTPTSITNGTVTGSAIAATADTTNQCLNLSFTPPTGNADTWHVVAHVKTVEAQ